MAWQTEKAARIQPNAAAATSGGHCRRHRRRRRPLRVGPPASPHKEEKKPPPPPPSQEAAATAADRMDPFASLRNERALWRDKFGIFRRSRRVMGSIGAAHVQLSLLLPQIVVGSAGRQRQTETSSRSSSSSTSSESSTTSASLPITK